LYAKRPHGAWGKVGDRVLMAIKGEKKQGIIVGLRVKQVSTVQHSSFPMGDHGFVLIDSGVPGDQDSLNLFEEKKNIFSPLMENLLG
jgi:hypothetical protein